MKTKLLTKILRGKTSVLTVMALAAMVTSAYAQIVTNGGFETTTGTSGNTVSNELSNGSYAGAGITGWTTNTPTGAYNIVYVPGSTAANTSYGTGNVTLQGSPATDGGSLASGNFVALDSDFPYPTGEAPISQTLSLISGDTYSLTFSYGADEQVGYNGTPFDTKLNVGIGGATTVVDVPSSLVLGTWHTDTIDFTASSASELLSFLANGGPSGIPSFVILDNVVVTNTTPTPPVIPEPGSLVLLSTGLLGLGSVVRARFKK